MWKTLSLDNNYKVTLVSDEIYYNMTYKEYDFISFGHLSKIVPVIVMTGFDKSYLCPGYENYYKKDGFYAGWCAMILVML